MLDNVVANVIDDLDEREFDAPLMALLRSMGFVDVHLTHGGYEFGKDIIAKLIEGQTVVQYVFQSKVGDLDMNKWGRLNGQLYMLRNNEVVHPNFDATLERRAVLVTTGRLVGGAAVAAQDYCRFARERRETPLLIWDRENLIEYMVAALNVGLAGRSLGPFLGALASIEDQTVTDRVLERLSRRWYAGGQDGPPCSLEAAILGVHLRKHNRVDLACYVALALVRAACKQEHEGGNGSDAWSNTADISRLIFRTYAEELWKRCVSYDLVTVAGFIRAHFEPAAIVTYRIRCLRIIEILSLLALLPESPSGPRISELTVWISLFMANQPGASQPVSDRWAVSIVPPALLLARQGLRDQLGSYLASVTTWISQAYCRKGLARPEADPTEEIRLLLGSVIGLAVSKREESYATTIVLDLAAFLGLRAVYQDARRQTRLAGALASVLITEDTVGQYLMEGSDVSLGTNVDYSDEMLADWSAVAPHLPSEAQPRGLEERGRAWDHLAISAVLRDRHFVCGWNGVSS